MIRSLCRLLNDIYINRYTHHNKYNNFHRNNNNDENDVLLVYVYETGQSSVDSNEFSPNIINAIIELFNLKIEFIYVDIEGGYDELYEVISSNIDDKRIVILSNFNSTELKDMVLYIENNFNTQNVFVISTFSSADDPVLNQNYILRLYPRDGINAQLFKLVLETVDVDNIVFLIDENDVWAHNLANDIESLFSPNTIIRLPLEHGVELPEGTMAILALAIDVLPPVFEILPDRTEDIRMVLFGDGSIGSLPENKIQLSLLQRWNTNIIMPKEGKTDQELITDIQNILNVEETLHSGINSLTIGTQIAAYLEKCVEPESFEDQYIIIGYRFEKETMDNITDTFYVMGYNEVNSTANVINMIGVSVLDENNQIKFFVTRELQ